MHADDAGGMVVVLQSLARCLQHISVRSEQEDPVPSARARDMTSKNSADPLTDSRAGVLSSRDAYISAGNGIRAR